MAVTITRTNWIDDDGSGTVGTVLNNAIKTELYNQIDGALAAVSTTVITNADTGTINNWAPGLSIGSSTILWTGSTDLTINGLVSSANGQQVTIRNSSSAILHCAHAVPANTAFYNVATSAPTRVGPNGWINYTYSSFYNLWVITGHNQAAGITAPYSAANFGGAGGATWTVDAADVTTLKYILQGRFLTVQMVLDTTSVGAGSLVQINNGAFGNYVFSAAGGGKVAYLNEGGTTTGGRYAVGSGFTYIAIYKDVGGFVSTTNSTSLQGVCTFEVQ